MTNDYQLAPIERNERPALYKLLGEADLTILGLDGILDSDILVARRNQRVIGSVALEVYEGNALLRSLAVSASDRGYGIGMALTDAVLQHARSIGVHTVFLLTETAEPFFSRFGFRSINRGEVPDAVRESVEFTTVCPESASVQRLTLLKKPRHGSGVLDDDE